MVVLILPIIRLLMTMSRVIFNGQLQKTAFFTSIQIMVMHMLQIKIGRPYRMAEQYGMTLWLS